MSRKDKPRVIPPPKVEGGTPSSRSIPRPRVFAPTGGEGKLRVRLGSVDVGGPWCLTNIKADHFSDLLERLRSFESMTCSELFHQGTGMGKVYPVADLPNKAARKRLTELEYDDQTEIARLQITGQRRLYGFLPDGGPDFYVLWWDPLHEIWPSKLKHT
jgi:hypothetical protein